LLQYLIFASQDHASLAEAGVIILRMLDLMSWEATDSDAPANEAGSVGAFLNQLGDLPVLPGASPSEY